MSDQKSILDRRSTRLSLSIPVNISGVDATGQTYSEKVRTVIINKHGGKIATFRPLALGAEVMIENHAVSLVAKASVVWVGEEQQAGGMFHVGLQLLEAQNIWGIAFPPDDWAAEQGEEVRHKGRPIAANDALPTGPNSTVPASTEDEQSIRVLHGLKESVGKGFQDFHNCLKQVTQRLGTELDSMRTSSASIAKERELGAMEEFIRNFHDNLIVTKDEIKKLEALVRDAKSELHAKR